MRALVDHDGLVRVGHERWDLRVDGRVRSVRVRGVYAADGAEPLRHAALAGLGIARLPDFLVRDDLQAGRLAAVLVDHEGEPGAIYAVYPQQRHLSPNVRALVDYLVEAIAS